MNTRLLVANTTLILGLAATAVVADGLAGSGPEISWHTIDGGGGTSTGGAFSLSGTIGQHDAGGPHAGGTYTLVGGFWPGAGQASDCPADINHDNSVNVTDLLAVITSWGSCALPCPPSCASDIAPPGGDCAVDVTDLLKVITTWGACP
jgi:hypothetical protein